MHLVGFVIRIYHKPTFVPIRMYAIVDGNTTAQIFVALNLSDSPYKVPLVHTCYAVHC